MNSAIMDALKGALRVWVVTTLALWIPGLLGWINEVTNWANQKGAPPFPDPSNLAFLFVAALTAAFPAAAMGIVRLIENLSGRTVLRPAGPALAVEPRNDRGESPLTIVLVVLVIIVVLVVLSRIV